MRNRREKKNKYEAKKVFLTRRQRGGVGETKRWPKFNDCKISRLSSWSSGELGLAYVTVRVIYAYAMTIRRHTVILNLDVFYA